MSGSEAEFGLLAWIGGLRHRLGSGELAGLGPIDVGYGPVEAERLVRIMLADLDHYGHLSASEREQPDTRGRRRQLLEDFRTLRDRIG